MAEFEAVLEARELGPGKKREVRAHGRNLVLVNFGQTYYALEARCPNDGTNLAREGELSGKRLTCPEDGWTYDVTTGRKIDPSGPPGLERRDLRVEGNKILIGPVLATD